MARLNLLVVAGARPNFMKVAPLLREFRRRPRLFDARLVHTGQHYDPSMSQVFFRQLGIPPPDIHLGVGSAGHAIQTARIMESFEKVLLERRADWVVVVGDVNSTLACSIVAAKMSPPIPVAHVEAGLRSGDRAMPEEINRIVTDSIASLLFTTGADADRNLVREGVDRRRIHRVGNVMIDTLRRFVRRSDDSTILKRLRLRPPFALLTLHRPSNVDDTTTLRRLYGAILTIAEGIPVVFPAHPRTVAMMTRAGVRPDGAASGAGLRLTPPLGYLDFLHLQKRAAFVLTDSGGIQEETTILGVPCLTLRDTTERPVTITQGTNRLVGSDPAAIVAAARRVLGVKRRRPRRGIALWDGRAAQRIAAVLARMLSGEMQPRSNAAGRGAAAVELYKTSGTKH